MKKTSIITPVLRYWQFKQHPFEDKILRGEQLNLFVNRGKKLHKMYNALSNRLNCIYGVPGVGKSSFLRKFEQQITNSGLPVAYVHITGTTEKTLNREILKSVLTLCNAKRIKTRKKFSLDVKTELERVNYSIQLVWENLAGANMVFKAEVKEIKGKQIEPHSENSASALIRDIIANTITPFIVVIDDLERIRYLLKNEVEYINFILGFTLMVDESFSGQSVSFVLSLDDGLVSHLRQKIHNKEMNENSFSFGELIELPNFNPSVLADVIKNRLTNYQWGKPIEKFITPAAFWALQLGTGGHARKAFAVIRSAMEHIEMHKLSKVITSDCIKIGLRSKGIKLDDRDIAIVKFLLKSEARSPSDNDFQKAVGLKQPALLVHLKKLTQPLNLQITEVTYGATKKHLYSLPPVDLESEAKT